MREDYVKTLTNTRFPMECWRRIRTNNSIERLKREIRRRTRVVSIFPDGNSPLVLVAVYSSTALTAMGTREVPRRVLLDE